MENNGDDSRQVLISAVLFVSAVIGFKYFNRLEIWLESSDQVPAVFVSLLSLATIILWRLISRLAREVRNRKFERGILGATPNSVLCGISSDGESVYIKNKQRSMHTQVVGTTNAGKTESVILPWAIQDIQQGRGLILIDGKSDRSLLDKLYGYTVLAGRTSDFKLFSISNIAESSQFNPLIGGTPEQVAERVFNSFEFENPYYRSVQFEIFGQILRVFEIAKIIPTFPRLHEAISQPRNLLGMVDSSNAVLRTWLSDFVRMDANERSKRVSGLTAAISHFAFGECACLYNSEKPGIDLRIALEKGQIIYFQLPVLLAPFLGKATGKLVLQALQSAVACRHNGIGVQPFYSVFLDDFTEYLYPGFVSILNKTRSANIGVVFAHQALGDIRTLGEPIANSILTNSNLKIFMRGNDPESAEYFSRVIGTKGVTKFTERAKKGLVGQTYTGDSSAREVEEFLIHPNHFKSSLGVGEAVMVIPHEKGSKCIQLKFNRFKDLKKVQIPIIPKNSAIGLSGKRFIKTKENKECGLVF